MASSDNASLQNHAYFSNHWSKIQAFIIWKLSKIILFKNKLYNRLPGKLHKIYYISSSKSTFELRFFCESQLCLTQLKIVQWHTLYRLSSVYNNSAKLNKFGPTFGSKNLLLAHSVLNKN